MRVVIPRIGIVLGENGGALQKMLLPFRLFAGGLLGSGRQWFPWVHRDDVVNIIRFAIARKELSGPVNVAAPEIVRMKGFCRLLGNTLHRPIWAPVPAPILRLALGEMAMIVLTGQKVLPVKLLENHYTFIFPKLKDALRDILRDRPKKSQG